MHSTLKQIDIKMPGKLGHFNAFNGTLQFVVQVLEQP